MTRTVTGWKPWPAGSTWTLPATGSSRSIEGGTAVAEKIWHGLLSGATHALTCTSPDMAARCSVLLASPLTSLLGLEKLRVPDPFTT